MTIFRVGEDQFEVDIFWLGLPKKEQKEVFEKYINKVVKESPYFDGMTDFVIKHIVADKNRCLSHLKEKILDIVQNHYS
ncbi:MAG: hypothetical protein R2837_09695 [Aliarcobacter sp.]